jgi:hypothetical protein
MKLKLITEWEFNGSEEQFKKMATAMIGKKGTKELIKTGRYVESQNVPMNKNVLKKCYYEYDKGESKPKTELVIEK